jgi:hypothetical protein
VVEGKGFNAREFIEVYVDGEMKLVERMNEVVKVIVERRNQIDTFRANLDEAKVTIGGGDISIGE